MDRSGFYPLSCGRWSAEAAPALGGNLARLEFCGRPVLRPFSETSEPFLWGSPLLLPANRTANARFSFRGRRFELPANEESSGANLHGSLHRCRFALTGRDGSSVSMEYENRGAVYPFPFLVRVRYALTERGFGAEYSIENTGDADMPFTFGLHTAFTEPELFSVPLAAEQERDASAIPTGRVVPLSPEEKQFTEGAASRGRVISGYFTSAGDTARVGDLLYQVSGFDRWVLYNARGAGGVLCVEPQRGAVNGLNTGEHPVLAPGETMTFTARIMSAG